MSTDQRNAKPGRLKLAALTVFLLGFLLVIAVATLLLTVEVAGGGSVTLPTGAVVNIQCGWRGFSASDSAEAASVQIAGYALEFDAENIKVDGETVAELDPAWKQLLLISDKDGVRLKAAGATVWSSE